MKREQISFYIVEDKHLVLHARLENWGHWCNNRTGRATSPMFRLYVPDEHWEGEAPAFSPNPLDAADMQKGVSALPEKHRKAINWSYVNHTNPRRKAQELGESLEGLSLLVRSARQMLLNRGYEKYRLHRLT